MNVLENLGLIRRSRAAGERMDRVRIDMSSSHAMGFDVSEYREMAELAREGLRLLAEAPPERKAILLEWAAFSDFLVERMPVLEQEGKAQPPHGLRSRLDERRGRPRLAHALEREAGALECPRVMLERYRAVEERHAAGREDDRLWVEV